MDATVQQLVARLQRDPNDGPAYEELKSRYRRMGDLASLSNLLEGWAGAHGDDWQRASDAYFEAGQVAASMGDPARAAALQRLALEANALHPGAGPALIELLERAGDAQQLAEFLDSYARTLEPVAGSAEYVASLYQRLAQLSDRDFGRSDLAQQYAARAQQLTAVPAATSMPAQARTDVAAIAAHYEQQVAQAQDPASKAALLAELADVHASAGDIASAIQALRHALAASSGDVTLMHKLAGFLLTRAETTDEVTARADRRRAAELLFQIAQVGDPEQAFEFVQSALGSMPEHERALALLERLAEDLGRLDVLPAYWVAYIAVAAEGEGLDRRRVLLGQAYLEAGQLEDARYCLQPAAEHGHDRAHELLQVLYAQQATDARSVGGAGQDERSSLPTAPRPPARGPERDRTEAASRVTELRRQVHEALTARRHDDAAAVCKLILELDPVDPEAFNFLESHYRKRRDHGPLRELLLASTRVPGLAVDVRKLRLREVATISETKLKDPEAATSAWRGVVTLDPSDREATASLKRLLKKAQSWDELASVLERETLTTTTVDEKASLLREIALLHRDRRGDRVETAEALRQLYALKPGDTGTRDELCGLLIALEQWPDAVPLLRERIETSRDEVEVLKLMAELATIQHEKTQELDDAYAVCEQLLARRPSDKATFERMERIDRELGNHRRLLTVLERRALMAPKVERPALFVRMGVIAEQELSDLDKAADYFGDALDLAPDYSEAMQHLTEMFERAGRYEQLVELLRERALLEREPKNRPPLYKRIAQVLAERLDDEEGAAEAYGKVLDAHEDLEALRFLKDVAQREDRPEQLADSTRRLIPLVTEPADRSALLFELAVVLHDRLERPKEAAEALVRLLEAETAPPLRAVELLETLSDEAGNAAGLALALERRLQLTPLPQHAVQRRAVARRLADLCQEKLDDTPRAIVALRQWSKDDPDAPEPLRRLRTLLEAEGRFGELLTTLDALAETEEEFDARDEAMIAAAQLAFHRLSDAQGAWRRLEPLVAQRNEQAALALREVAAGAQLEAQLSALYVDLAQQSDDPGTQAAHWGAAADLLENALGDDAQALEASLRMLATDLENRRYLATVERLAGKTRAYKRVAAVYDRLLKGATEDDEKVELLSRHAALLEGDHPEDALDRILRACALAPQDEALMARAEQLAERTQRSEELLVVYDRKRQRQSDPLEKTHLVLRAARLCDGALRDRDRANQYLKTAMATAADTAELWPQIEATARELDRLRPELGADSARKALVRSIREVAERAEQEIAVRLLLRAAAMLKSDLDDERGAFDLLRQGLALQPRSEEIYVALLDLAGELKRLDALDAQLSRLIDETFEPVATVTLLRRRGALLEGPLNRFQDAAAVYTKLLQVRPDDAEASGKLVASLRRSGRHQDLLLVLNKQLQRARDQGQRVDLLRQIATTWERDIKNRWEALDAWKAVLREVPDDEETLAAMERIERSRTMAGQVAAPEVAAQETSALQESSASEPSPQEPSEAAQAAADEDDEAADDETPTVPPPALVQSDAGAEAQASTLAGALAGATASEAATDRGASEEADAGRDDDDAGDEPEVEIPDVTPNDFAAAEREHDTVDEDALTLRPQHPSRPEPEPEPEDADADGDLGALDAVLGMAAAHRQELDVFESRPVEPARSSAPPVPPPPQRRVSLPPAPPSRSAPPPPLPQTLSAGSRPPALPSLAGAIPALSDAQRSAIPALPPRPSSVAGLPAPPMRSGPPARPAPPPMLSRPPRPVTVDVGDDDVEVVVTNEPPRNTSRPPPLPARASRPPPLPRKS